MKKTLGTLLLALALVSTGAACNRDDDDDRTTARRDDRSSGGEARRENDAERGADPAYSATESGPEVETAQDQSMASTDEDITRQIRQAIVGDDDLSVAARNVTIVTRSGVVTLHGSVPDGDERAAIERHARSVSGVSRVDNRVDVRD